MQDSTKARSNLDSPEVIWGLDKCDVCGFDLPSEVWGAREAICPNCGRKFECC